VVRVAREFQSWALVERLCDESAAEASRDAGRAAFLARLAREIAERLPGRVLSPATSRQPQRICDISR
jgi:hypothetical protein